jgi:hypothetical protein
MSISVNPVIGFNFLSSLSSVFGESLTLTAASGATRNDTDGLVLTAGGAVASAAAPVALQLALPITLMARVVRVANGSAGDTGFGLDDGSEQTWRAAFEHRGTGAGWRLRYDSNGTLATLTTSDTPVNPQTVTYFLQFTASAITAWTDTTQVGNSAASRSSPLYGGSPTLYLGRATFGANVTHFAMWNAVLTADDRTELVADPMAYVSSSGPSAAAIAQYRRHQLLEAI